MNRLNLTAIPVFLLLVGCNAQPESLAMSDLTADEALFIERYVTLERARMVTLARPDEGEAILDSLALAWGDSAEAEAMRMLPTDPRRAQLVHDLLRRLLDAEMDSLTHAPRADRITAPLPEPIPPK